MFGMVSGMVLLNKLRHRLKQVLHISPRSKKVCGDQPIKTRYVRGTRQENLHGWLQTQLMLGSGSIKKGIDVRLAAADKLIATSGTKERTRSDLNVFDGMTATAPRGRWKVDGNILH